MLASELFSDIDNPYQIDLTKIQVTRIMVIVSVFYQGTYLSRLPAIRWTAMILLVVPSVVALSSF